MVEVFINESENLSALIKKLLHQEDKQVVLKFSKNSPLLSNTTNLKVIRSLASREGKEVSFTSEAGLNLEGDLAAQKVEPTTESGGSRSWLPKKPSFKNISFGGGLAKFWGALDFLPDFFQKNILQIALLVGALALLLIFLFSSLIYLPRATVEITVGSEVFVKSVSVEARTSVEELDVEDRLIEAMEISTLEKGEGQVDTSGEKVVGKKARGTVTLYNKTDDEKILPQGTNLTYPRVEGDNLAFSLESTVSVPARSEATSSAESISYSSGQVEVGILADDFGEEYNLPSGSKFSVGDLSADKYLAKNDAAFTGGEKTTVSVVAEEDKKTLLQEVRKDIKQVLEEELKGKVPSGYVLQEGAWNFDILSEEYSAEVDEEAEELDLSLEAQALGLIYKRESLEELLDEVFEDLVPSDFEVFSDDREIEVAVEEADLDDGVLTLRIKIKSYVVPKMNSEEVKNALTGQPLDYVREYLDGVENVVDYNLKIWPPLPGVFSRMPKLAERIQVEISRE